MRSDWNDRAAEDAYYFVAFGRRRQNDQEFFETADEVLAWLRHEAQRLHAAPRECRALEIGCGPARLIRPLSDVFAEVHGVDVSDRMIELAKRNLAGVRNAYVRANSGADLSAIGDASMDFIYSYAVFQHIPSRDVVMQYLREAIRVLKPGGILTCQINGLPDEAPEFSTWDGARLPAPALVALAGELNCQILALDGIGSQYMWTTWRKRDSQWRDAGPAVSGGAEIREARSAAGRNRVPAARAGEVSLTLKGVHPDWDVAGLSALIGGQPATMRVIHIPSADAVGDITILVPAIAAACAVNVQIFWRGQPACAPFPVDVVEFENEGPSLFMLTDGINILSGRNVVSRFVKILVDNVTEPGRLRAEVNGRAIDCSESVCIDPQRGRYEFNAFLPGSVGRGSHRIDVFEGTKHLAYRHITVGIQQGPDVFRGAPPGACVLEFDGQEWRVIRLGQDSAGEPVAVDGKELQFPDSHFTGVVFRVVPEGVDWREVRRVLKPGGGVYVEAPAGERTEAEIAAGLDLRCRWKRDLARPLGQRRPVAETKALTVLGRARAVWSLLLRAADRRFGIRWARGRAGYYFGEPRSEPDLRARLNGCVRCGDVASHAQLVAAGPPVRSYGLKIYLCPSCGAPNILTEDW